MQRLLTACGSRSEALSSAQLQRRDLSRHHEDNHRQRTRRAGSGWRSCPPQVARVSVTPSSGDHDFAPTGENRFRWGAVWTQRASIPPHRSTTVGAAPPQHRRSPERRLWAARSAATGPLVADGPQDRRRPLGAAAGAGNFSAGTTGAPRTAAPAGPMTELGPAAWHGRRRQCRRGGTAPANRGRHRRTARPPPTG